MEPDRSLGQIERLLGPTGYLLLWRNDSEGKSPSETAGKSDRRGEYDTINRRIDKSYIYIFIDIHTHKHNMSSGPCEGRPRTGESRLQRAASLLYTPSSAPFMKMCFLSVQFPLLQRGLVRI